MLLVSEASIKDEVQYVIFLGCSQYFRPMSHLQFYRATEVQYATVRVCVAHCNFVA